MIKLRPTTILDCNFIIKCNHGQNEVFLHQWAGPSYSYPISINQIMQRLQDSIYTKFFTATLNDEIIGTVELGFINYKKKECKICRFLIGDNYRNKGYGTQITKLLLNYAFNDLNMSKVSLHISSYNIAAKRCYEKAGFAVIEDKITNNSKISALKMGIDKENRRL